MESNVPLRTVNGEIFRLSPRDLMLDWGICKVSENATVTAQQRIQELEEENAALCKRVDKLLKAL